MIGLWSTHQEEEDMEKHYDIIWLFVYIYLKLRKIYINLVWDLISIYQIFIFFDWACFVLNFHSQLFVYFYHTFTILFFSWTKSLDIYDEWDPILFHIFIYMLFFTLLSLQYIAQLIELIFIFLLTMEIFNFIQIVPQAKDYYHFTSKAKFNFDFFH